MLAARRAVTRIFALRFFQLVRVWAAGRCGVLFIASLVMIPVFPRVAGIEDAAMTVWMGVVLAAINPRSARV